MWIEHFNGSFDSWTIFPVLVRSDKSLRLTMKQRVCLGLKRFYHSVSGIVSITSQRGALSASPHSVTRYSPTSVPGPAALATTVHSMRTITKKRGCTEKLATSNKSPPESYWPTHATFLLNSVQDWANSLMKNSLNRKEKELKLLYS